MLNELEHAVRRIAKAAALLPRLVEESSDLLPLFLPREATTRLRAPFRGLVAKDFEVFEGDGRNRFRLKPALLIEMTDWETIAKHPDLEIAGLAAKALRRKGK